MSATRAQVAHRARVNPKQVAIQALAETGNITAAAKRAGVDRNSIYRWQKNDALFADAMEQALEISTDLLELEARRRATEGVREPVFYKGDIVGHIHKPSDRLMELLLKAHRPDKYSDKQHIDLNANFTVEVAQFAAPGVTIPGTVIDKAGSQVVSDNQKLSASDTLSVEIPGDEASSVERDAGGVSRGVPPKVDSSLVDDSVDIADFSKIFPE